ncbi:hypothetical protein [Paracandidimonas soli]|uniref:Uncharacterized protein n=1 Tax=Paracandidimonas soli TaxID=1917182 RepID=A0A4R3UMK1_9BURK|nr:hypothetical protein [Paracandidimonas soli]TCU91633.1 hypothetical protein EV686_11729 [Paracandidimonas soli]
MTATATFNFDSSYTFHYDTPRPVPIREAIESLIGIEKLLATLPKVTKKLIGFDDFTVEIVIEDVHTGSLWERIGVRYVFGSEEKMNEFIDRVKTIMPPSALVPVLVASVLAYGGYLLTRPSPGPTVTVGDITNSIVVVGNGTQTITSDVAEAVITGIRNKKEIAGATIETLRPAMNQPGSSLKIYGGSAQDSEVQFEVPATEVKKIPKEMPHTRIEETADLKHVIVDVRAIDLDNPEKGWEGRIEGLTGRIKIEFEDDIDLEEVANRRKFNADVVLTSRYRGSESEPRPHSMLIEKIY